MITYCDGPNLFFEQDLSKNDYINLCKTLSLEFTKSFGGVYVFEPEPITEGGFILTHFPGKKDEMYKTLRHHLRDGIDYIEWPYIPNNVMNIWKDDQKILIQKSTTARTILKALYGAPTWKIEEIKLFCEVLQKFKIDYNINDFYTNNLSRPTLNKL
jgi:hypothetical protein